MDRKKPAVEKATSNQKASTTATLDTVDANTDATIEEDIQDNIVAEGWTEVKRRRSRVASSVEILRGVAIAGATSLEAAEKMDYLHLFYVKEGTTDVQVREHLAKICGSDVCTVVSLKSRGKYASFKLGVPSKLTQRVMAAENWTKDICLKQWTQNFRNFRKKHKPV